MTEAERCEREDLAMADRHIADGERLVTKQGLLIASLEAEGRDTTLAEELLAVLKQTLNEHHVHRGLILARIEHLNAFG